MCPKTLRKLKKIILRKGTRGLDKNCTPHYLKNVGSKLSEPLLAPCARKHPHESHTFKTVAPPLYAYRVIAGCMSMLVI